MTYYFDNITKTRHIKEKLTNESPKPDENLPVKTEYNLVAKVSTYEDVLTEMGGEPNSYIWSNVTYTKNNLPPIFCMRYNISGSMLDYVIETPQGSDKIIREMRIDAGDDFYCLESFDIGTTLEDAITILGEPESTVDGGANDFNEDVLYKNIDGTTGRHYYNDSSNQIRVFFSSNIATAIYIYGGNNKIKIKQ